MERGDEDAHGGAGGGFGAEQGEDVRVGEQAGGAPVVDVDLLAGLLEQVSPVGHPGVVGGGRALSGSLCSACGWGSGVASGQSSRCWLAEGLGDLEAVAGAWDHAGEPAAHGARVDLDQLGELLAGEAGLRQRRTEAATTQFGEIAAAHSIYA